MSELAVRRGYRPEKLEKTITYIKRNLFLRNSGITNCRIHRIAKTGGNVI